jgi:hypothetical protein
VVRVEMGEIYSREVAVTLGESMVYHCYSRVISFAIASRDLASRIRSSSPSRNCKANRRSILILSPFAYT